mgnify:FL=1
MKKIVKIILLAVCLGVFCFSGYKIYQYLHEEKANKELNNKLIEKAVVENQKTNVLEEDSQAKNELPINVDFTALKQENEDIVGWLYSENTQINYPVVQSEDNNYYLRRLVNGEYNIAGSLFMDYRNNSNLEDNNTIIYGHNMENDTMFGTLQEYKSQEYYDNHKVLYYFTQEKNYMIQLFAGYTISVESDIYDLSIIDESKIEESIQNSDFNSDVEVREEDKIMTLSTCAYEYDGARYIIMGVLHEIKE